MKKKQSKPPEPLRLDLGGGQNAQPGYKVVDLYAPKPDYRVDLFKFPWPFKDESVEEIYCSHFFEHVPGPLRFQFMDECWRILRLGGQIKIVCPYGTSHRAIQDPTHCWPPIVEESFLYFDQTWRILNKLDHYPVSCNFMFTHALITNPKYQGRNQEFLQEAHQAFWNSVDDIHVLMTKIRQIPNAPAKKEEKAKK